MIEQLVETWMINNRVNLMVLDHLDKQTLECTLSTRGGRTVGSQFAHLYAVRQTWIEVIDKKLAAGLPAVERESGHDKELLAEGFRKSADALASVIRQSGANEGKVKGFKRGILPMVGYMISHEAHHRGSILLTLKQSGFKLDAALRWGIWDWQKI